MNLEYRYADRIVLIAELPKEIACDALREREPLAARAQGVVLDGGDRLESYAGGNIVVRKPLRRRPELRLFGDGGLGSTLMVQPLS